LESGLERLLANAVDLTYELKNGMTIYPGNPKPSFQEFMTIQKEGVNLMEIRMGSHTGTHVDAPHHFIGQGKTVDELPIDRYSGLATVLDFSTKTYGNGITDSDLEATFESSLVLSKERDQTEIVILYTGCSEEWNSKVRASVAKNYTYLDKTGAEWLVRKNKNGGRKRIKCVGIDFLSVEKFGSKEAATHKTLLRNDVLPIEALNNEVSRFIGKQFLLLCFPLKIKGADGAAVRAVGLPLSN
jgi:arylformamidase